MSQNNSKVRRAAKEIKKAAQKKAAQQKAAQQKATQQKVTAKKVTLTPDELYKAASGRKLPTADKMVAVDNSVGAATGLKRQASDTAMLPSTQTYIDILRSELARRKVSDTTYSLRKFSKDIRCEIGALSRIIGGERPLSLQIGLRILGRLNLSEADESAFRRAIEDTAMAIDSGAKAPERSSYVTKKEVATAMASSVGQEAPLSWREKSAKEKEDARLKAQAEQEIVIQKIDAQTRVISRVGIARQGRSGIYITSCLVPNADPHEGLMTAMATLAKRLGVTKQVYVAGGAHKLLLDKRAFSLSEATIDMVGEDNIYGTYVFSPRLMASNEPIQPQTESPFNGLEYIARDGYENLGVERMADVIFPTPRLDHQAYPTGNASVPREFYCSGSVCHGLYQDSRVGRKAHNRHKYGFCVVYVNAKGQHDVVQVEAAADGSFNFRGTRYNPDGTYRKEKALAALMPDLHAGLHNEQTLDFLLRTYNEIGVEQVFMGDVFDSLSVSHHLADDVLQKLGRPSHMATLFREFVVQIRTMRKIRTKLGNDVQLFVVGSNHQDHVCQYLGDGRRWTDDHINVPLAALLYTGLTTYDVSPLAYGIELVSTGLATLSDARREAILKNPELATDAEVKAVIRAGISPKEFAANSPNTFGITWVNESREEDHYLGDEHTNLSMHGDCGANGARGNYKAYARLLGSGGSGHSHTGARKDDWVQVGTATDRLSYARGLSSWTKCTYVFQAGLGNKTLKQRYRDRGYYFDIKLKDLPELDQDQSPSKPEAAVA